MSAGIRILTAIYLLIVAGIIVAANLKSTVFILDFLEIIPYNDKIGHFFLFGISAFLLNLSFGARQTGFGKFRYLSGSLIVLAIITIEEFTQIFMSGRTFSWLDLFCGYAGILFFGELGQFFYKKLSAGKVSR